MGQVYSVEKILQNFILVFKRFWLQSAVSGFYAGSHPLPGAILDAEVLNHLCWVKREVLPRWCQKADGKKGRNMGK